MFSVAILDFVQMTVIMAGMLYIGYVIAGLTGGVGVVVAHAHSAGKLAFFPEGGPAAWVPFFGAWITMMLGSIPQQDVFQRITSAKDEKTAVRGSVLGGTIYFLFAFVPMFLAYAATLVDPKTFSELLATDSQLVLPRLILQHTPLFAQVVFFGALLSAIMSCSSATLLAPSVAFSENIIRNVFPNMSDHVFLRTMRVVLVCFTCIVLAFALNSGASIFKMVENAYKITLVVAFFPLFLGLYWKRTTTQGALAGIAAGFCVWVLLEFFGTDNDAWPPQLFGFLAAGISMVAGSLLPQVIGRPTPDARHHGAHGLPESHGAPGLHGHAAGHTNHVAATTHHHGKPR
jgi:Na+/proline symporter